MRIIALFWPLKALHTHNKTITTPLLLPLSLLQLLMIKELHISIRGFIFWPHPFIHITNTWFKSFKNLLPWEQFWWETSHFLLEHFIKGFSLGYSKVILPVSSRAWKMWRRQKDGLMMILTLSPLNLMLNISLNPPFTYLTRNKQYIKWNYQWCPI